jgi:hypothetical protein
MWWTGQHACVAKLLARQVGGNACCAALQRFSIALPCRSYYVKGARLTFSPDLQALMPARCQQPVLHSQQ